MPKGWFGPKLMGYGISPRSWEGWPATAIFVAGLFALLKIAAPDLSPMLGLSRATLQLCLGAAWVLLYFILVGATYAGDA